MAHVSASSGYRRAALVTLAIAFVVGLLYSNTLGSPFVFDDSGNIVENRFIRMTQVGGSELYQAAFASRLDRPVAYLSFALNYYVGGYEVAGYHVVNIVIHGINGILVYLLALFAFRRHSGARELLAAWMALISALVFVAHPLQTQAVTYIVQRMTSLSVTFYLLALLLYIHGRLQAVRWRRWAFWGGGLVSWILALGSKEIAAVLPVAILLCEWAFFSGAGGGRTRRGIAYSAASVAILAVLVLVFIGENPVEKTLRTYVYRDFTMAERVLTEFRVVVLYLSLWLLPLPSRLNLLHPISLSRSLLEPVTTILSLLLVVGLVALALVFARKNRLASFCILWMLLHLMIESSVIGLELIFEHRMYLPSVGLAIVTSNLLFAGPAPERVRRIAVSLLVIGLLGIATYFRNEDWRDKVTLWSDVIAKNPESSRAHDKLGVALAAQGRLAEAIEHYREALRLDPGRPRIHNHLGLALHEQGRTDEAIPHFHAALRVDPTYAVAHNNLGNVFTNLEREEKALEHFSEAVRLDPDFVEAHYNLGIALARQGRTEDAARRFSEALRLWPDFAAAHNDLGLVLARQGRLDAAVREYAEALRFEPDYPEAHNNLGAVLAQQGRLDEAMRHYFAALRSEPTYAKAHNNLGIALEQQGRLDEAIRHYSAALESEPAYAKAHNNLGVALARQGRLEEAVGHFHEAVRIDPGSREARENLERARRESGAPPR
jgi:tetratricopeptide (TPR) repeat protein